MHHHKETKEQRACSCHNFEREACDCRQLMPEAHTGTNIKSLIVPSTTRNEVGGRGENEK